MISFTTRLKGLRGKESQADFAARIGVSLATYGRYERGLSTPDAETLSRIGNVTGVDVDWLLFGPGGGRAVPEGLVTEEGDCGCGGASQGGGPVRLRGFERPEHEMAFVPMVEARLSAGGEGFEIPEGTERRYSFQADFLRRKGQLEKMALMRVAGDSMAPEIRNGDVVLIDRSQDQPQAGGVYAVVVEELVYLKIIDSVPGKLILSSFNKAHGSFEIDTRDGSERNVRILGRVVWSCREW